MFLETYEVSVTFGQIVMKLEFSGDFQKNIQTSNFTKILLVGAEFFNGGDGRTHRQTFNEVKSFEILRTRLNSAISRTLSTHNATVQKHNTKFSHCAWQLSLAYELIV